MELNRRMPKGGSLMMNAMARLSIAILLCAAIIASPWEARVAGDEEGAVTSDRAAIANAQTQVKEMSNQIAGAKDPGPELFEGRGDAYMVLKQYDRAYADFSTLVDSPRRRDRYKCLRKLMEAAIQVGYHREALQIARTLEFTTPRDSYLLSLIALLQAGSDDDEVYDPDAALETARSALLCKEEGGVVTVDLALAAAFSVNGDFEKAINHQEKAIKDAAGQAKDEWKAQLEAYKAKKKFRLSKSKVKNDE